MLQRFSKKPIYLVPTFILSQRGRLEQITSKKLNLDHSIFRNSVIKNIER